MKISLGKTIYCKKSCSNIFDSTFFVPVKNKKTDCFKELSEETLEPTNVPLCKNSMSIRWYVWKVGEGFPDQV